MTFKPPFQERKSRLRGVLDLVSGCYPRFCFGGGIDGILPIFHFHDVTAGYLEPFLRYLKENGYSTVTSEAMGRWARDGRHPGPRRVVLTFDDAWACMWTVVLPLLRQYEMTAVTYVAPARIADAETARDPDRARPGDGEPFCTWPEIKALQESGRVDVQAHTLTHARIFCSDALGDFVNPRTRMRFMDRPVVAFDTPPGVLDPSMLGAPLYPARSRMSDALRYRDDETARRACMDHVAANGGAAFFDRPRWRQELEAIAARTRGRFESDAEREQSQWRELHHARERLEARLGAKTIRQVCFPWAVCGRLAEHLVVKAGYETAVADVLWGRRAMHARTNPLRIMRLKHTYIPCLPGKGRRNMRALAWSRGS